MGKYILYSHGGSKNHGCEAIVRCTCIILNIINEGVLYSLSPEQDRFYNLQELINVELSIIKLKKYSFKRILNGVCSRILRYRTFSFYTTYKKILNNKNNLCFSIGGDNYCGYGMEKTLKFLNKKLNNYNTTILWGCSVEPELLKNYKILEDLKRYSLITARESITYNAMVSAGLKNVRLFPDPAFVLNKQNIDLPINFIEGKTIGINLSPLIQNREHQENITLDNYLYLIKYILNNSDNNVALIPHVIVKNNNDLTPLKLIYEKFKDSSRICLIDEEEELNCMQLKYVISKCKMFVCARTHASIAAYSTCVPTLVVGYSVKAKGIAKDIFGTYDNYVLPVQSLKNKKDLLTTYKWLETNENNIREHLNNVMPNYTSRAWQACEAVKGLIKSIEN